MSRNARTRSVQGSTPIGEPAHRNGTHARTTLGERLAAIGDAPEGPAVAAVVDLDDALLSTDPLGPWLGGAGDAAERSSTISWDVVSRLGTRVLDALGAGGPELSAAERVGRAVEAWAGREAAELATEAESAFRSATSAALRTEVWRLLRAHRTRGHTVLLTSSATRFQLEPVATELGADAVLGTDVEIVDGALTGRLDGPVLIGDARSEALRKLAADRGVDLDASFGYAAVGGDRSVLDAVGHPVLVSPSGEDGPAGSAVPVLTSPDRGTPMGPVEWASTAGFYAGFLTSTAVGASIGALRGSRYEIWNATSRIAADTALAAAGIDVEARGVENMWKQRPAVFVFNHMGLMDAIVAMKLLQGGFTGVAKAETRNWPVFGQLFQIADVAFVDRAGGSAQAVRKAMEPAVDKLRSGISLALAPEGTRSPTPTPGPFKKGAFHMAVQAGVPIVPIVLHNSGEVMWRKDVAMRPGTIRVDVLEPVDTSTWSTATLDEHVAHVRGLFLETLDGVPERRGAEQDSGGAR